MRFFSQLAAFAATAATVASATNTITFINQDSTVRTIYYTGTSVIEATEIQGNDQVSVDIPEGWIGNWYSVSEGQENTPGMLGEVTFQGGDGKTYFDVSSIVDPNDKNGVKQLFPASEMDSTVKTLISGCVVFPCNTVYIEWNDVQTVVTTETDLVCTLGNASEDVETRDERHLVARKFVLGQY
ncbi:DNase1 protein [Xylariaceae sp. FL0016]|nr:DNase1 protein [Xylariaceae sp. FL0016]